MPRSFRQMRKLATASQVATGLWIAFAFLSSSSGFGCTLEERNFDQFPVSIEARAGAVFAAAAAGDETPIPVTIDTLSPITILDSFDGGDTLNEGERLAVELRLFSQRATPQGTTTAERLRFPNTEVFDIHPCDDGGPPVNCQVGFGNEVAAMQGTIGTNLLGQQAVRFDFPNSQVRFFPDIAGTNGERSELCEAVFTNTFAGSGTLEIANGEVDYVGRRPAVGACLDAADPTGTGVVLEERGVDALLVISTGIGVSILARSTYEEYARNFELPDIDALPETVLHLPSGPTGARLAEIGHLTLVGDVADDREKRGPCGELYANRLIAGGLCADGTIADGDCPCPDGADFCRVGASLLLRDTIEVAVIDDEHPLLQALRVELRPAFPEVEGILGASALASTRVDFDYPNQRIAFRCQDEDRCRVRPQVIRQADLPAIQQCLNAGY